MQNTSLDELRILLWDIDGTLLHSTVRGGYKKYFSAAMRRVFGFEGNLDELVPSGMTDTQIMWLALEADGVTPEDIFAKVDELLVVFQNEMRAVVEANGEPYEILPGAREILERTKDDPRFVNALLTGNLSVAAEIKLESIGLWDFFKDSPGAFGELSHRRNDLAHAAGRLFNERYNFEFDPSQFIVIGDTPNDIACARDFGAKVIAVATGRGQSREALVDAKPDALLEDLSSTNDVLHILHTL